MTHTRKLSLIALFLLLIPRIAWSQANQILVGTPAALPTYYAAFFGVAGDNMTNDCAALTTPTTGALAVVSAVGPAYLQLPQRDLTLLMNCDLNIPANVILRGSQTNGWNAGTTQRPKSGLHLMNSSGSGAIIQCIQKGVCGLQDMYVLNDTNSRPFLLYTCSVPWLDNVMFVGETPANVPMHVCAAGGVGAMCPDNDGIYFGNGIDTSSTCNNSSNADGFAGYGSDRITNLYFQNIRQWIRLGANANGLHIHNVHGDYTDAYPTGYAIELQGQMGTPNNFPSYANHIYDVDAEAAPFMDSTMGHCNNLGIFGLTGYASNNVISYDASDANNPACAHTAVITDTTSSQNKITVLTSNTSSTPVSDAGAGNVSNAIEDLTSRNLSWRSFTAVHIGTAFVGPYDITFGAYTIGTLPPTPPAYMVAWISNGDGTCTGTGSVKVLCFYDGTGWKPLGNLSSPTFTSPYIGAATGTSLAVSGKLDGQDIVVLDTTTPISLGTTNQTSKHFNQNGTAGTAVTYNLPVAAAGRRHCIANSSNSTPAPDTGILTLKTSGPGQFVIFTDGTLSGTGGGVHLTAATGGEEICVEGLDANHWQVIGTPRGAWATF